MTAEISSKDPALTPGMADEAAESVQRCSDEDATSSSECSPDRTHQLREALKRFTTNWEKDEPAACIPAGYHPADPDPLGWPVDAMVHYAQLSEIAPGQQSFAIVQQFLLYHLQKRKHAAGRRPVQLNLDDIDSTMKDMNLLKQAIQSVRSRWNNKWAKAWKYGPFQLFKKACQYETDDPLTWPPDVVLAIRSLVNVESGHSSGMNATSKRITAHRLKRIAADEHATQSAILEDVTNAIRELEGSEFQLHIPESFASVGTSYLPKETAAMRGDFVPGNNAGGRTVGTLQTASNATDSRSSIPAAATTKPTVDISDTHHGSETDDANVAIPDNDDPHVVFLKTVKLHQGAPNDVEQEAGMLDDDIQDRNGQEETDQKNGDQTSDHHERAWDSFSFPTVPSGETLVKINKVYENVRNRTGAAFGHPKNGPTIMSETIAAAGVHYENICRGTLWAFTKSHNSYCHLKPNWEAISFLESRFGKPFYKIIKIDNIKADQALRITSGLLPRIVKLVHECNIGDLNVLHTTLANCISNQPPPYNRLTVDGLRNYRAKIARRASVDAFGTANPTPIMFAAGVPTPPNNSTPGTLTPKHSRIHSRSESSPSLRNRRLMKIPRIDKLQRHPVHTVPDSTAEAVQSSLASGRQDHQSPSNQTPGQGFGSSHSSGSTQTPDTIQHQDCPIGASPLSPSVTSSTASVTAYHSGNNSGERILSVLPGYSGPRSYFFTPHASAAYQQSAGSGVISSCKPRDTFTDITDLGSVPGDSTAHQGGTASTALDSNKKNNPAQTMAPMNRPEPDQLSVLRAQLTRGFDTYLMNMEQHFNRQPNRAPQQCTENSNAHLRIMIQNADRTDEDAARERRLRLEQEERAAKAERKADEERKKANLMAEEKAKMEQEYKQLKEMLARLSGPS